MIVRSLMDTSGAVYVRGMIGGTLQTVAVTPAEWTDAPFPGGAGLRWLLADKLARQFTRAGARNPPKGNLEYVDEAGQKIPISSWPETFEQLAEQTRRGIMCIVRVPLRGGMDGGAPAKPPILLVRAPLPPPSPQDASGAAH